MPYTLTRAHCYDIDIAWGCNLKCPSCPQGNSPWGNRGSGLMKFELFKEIIGKISRDAPPGSSVALFNWAESFLHPQLPQFIRFVKQQGLRCEISTNFNILRDDLEDILNAGPDFFRISNSGMVAEHYSFTHRNGKIENVIENMRRLRGIIDKLQAPADVELLYHKYLHNLKSEDYDRMAGLCRDLRFRFHPVYAFLMPIGKIFDYLEDRLPEQDRQIVDFMAVRPDEGRIIARKYPPADCLLRSDRTSIDPDGSVPLCCGVYDKTCDIANNFLAKTPEELQALKYAHPLCAKCMANGIPGYVTYAGLQEWDKIALKKYQEIYADPLNPLITLKDGKPHFVRPLSPMPATAAPPAVTIGFPVYNAEKQLRRALDSLLAQDYPNFIILISDNASTDATYSICQEYAVKDSRVRVHRNPTNIGAVMNFQKVLDMADSEFFMWAAHDDYWEKTFISKCVALLIANPDAVLSFCDVQFIDPSGVPVAYPFNPVNTAGMDLRGRVKTVVEKMNWYAIYGIFRREILSRNKFYFNYGMDVIFLMEAALDGQFVIVPEKLFHYRLAAKTIQDDLKTINPPGLSTPIRTPVTGLAQNMVAVVAQSELGENDKIVLTSDIVHTIAFNNPAWRNAILMENPFLQNYLNVKGQELNLSLSLALLFSSLLLSENTLTSDREVRKYLAPPPTAAGATPLKKTRVRPDGKGKLRILFQNRPHIDKQPGGDSVVMLQSQKELQALGHKVDINADPVCDLSGYDIVHLFNLTLPAITDAFAQNALRQNVPFVITSLQEDFPLYQNKAVGAFMIFQKYLECNQDRDLFPRLMELLAQHAQTANQNPDGITTAHFAAANAAMIFACGKTEAEYVKQLHPSARVSAVPFGSSIKEKEIGPEPFCETFGVKNFVLCVARLEVRKNQLMLLKALEDDDIPLVFADGGFTYQQAYTDACRKFRRKGKTIFTGRLTEELLLSAYKAAAVHCLPSWYELPGLVTLEAARYGCKIVASSWGAIGDYMGDACSYCAPDDPASIRSAVFNAIGKPLDPSTLQTASSFTWAKSAAAVLDHYRAILGSAAHDRAAPPLFPDFSLFMETVVGYVEQNENKRALEYYNKFRTIYGKSSDFEKFDSLMGAVKKKLDTVAV
ncbi:MAG: glycosyltransferase [Chitinivibrionales bacterium]|nr:glycosyltransferase [Chitinivibrionales bacterium]